MKKISTFLLITAYCVLRTPFKIHAQDIDYSAYNAALGNKLGNSNVGTIIGLVLPTVLTLAGLILFGMLVMGGFTMLAGAADKESQEKGKKMITSAITGFIIIFLAYWIAQILQIIFKINIVS